MNVEVNNRDRRLNTWEESSFLQIVINIYIKSVSTFKQVLFFFWRRLWEVTVVAQGLGFLLPTSEMWAEFLSLRQHPQPCPLQVLGVNQPMRVAALCLSHRLTQEPRHTSSGIAWFCCNDIARKRKTIETGERSVVFLRWRLAVRRSLGVTGMF